MRSSHLSETFLVYCFSGMMQYVLPLWKLSDRCGAGGPSSSVLNPLACLPGREKNLSYFHITHNVLILPTMNWAPSLPNHCASIFPMLFLILQTLGDRHWYLFERFKNRVNSSYVSLIKATQHQSLGMAVLILCHLQNTGLLQSDKVHEGLC